MNYILLIWLHNHNFILVFKPLFKRLKGKSACVMSLEKFEPKEFFEAKNRAGLVDQK